MWSEAGGQQQQQQQQPVEERGVGLVVVQLENMVERDELLDDEEYEDLLEDTRGEVAKYGELVQVLIPRPSPQGEGSDPPGVGLVFLEYATASSAEKARLALHGREFGDKPIAASLLDKAGFLVKQPGQQQEKGQGEQEKEAGVEGAAEGQQQEKEQEEQVGVQAEEQGQ